MLDFDQRKSFLKNLKSVRAKVLIKSFTNQEAVNFFKVFHSNVTSFIQTVSNTSVLDKENGVEG